MTTRKPPARRSAGNRRQPTSGRQRVTTGTRTPQKRVSVRSPVVVRRKRKTAQRKLTLAGLAASLIAGLIALVFQAVVWLVVTAVLTVITLAAWALEGRDEPPWAELRRSKRTSGPPPPGSRACRAKNRLDMDCGNVTTNQEGYCWWHRHWRRGGAAA